MATLQAGNTVGQDLVGGDKYENNHHYYTQPTPLSRLYSILRTADQESSYTSQIADTLRHYCTTTTSADIRGLEEKLSSSGRSDLIHEASELKEKASKLIMRWQTSPVTQDIITHILSKLHTDFMLNVRPAIQAGKSREDVDELISTKVLKPATDMLGDNDLGVTSIDLLGMLFFLGGNCHVRWDKC